MIIKYGLIMLGLIIKHVILTIIIIGNFLLGKLLRMLFSSKFFKLLYLLSITFFIFKGRMILSLVMVGIWLLALVYMRKGESSIFINDKESKDIDNVENFFTGCNKAEAETKYNELIEKYHPKDKAGDIVNYQKVVVAYRNYCVKNKVR